MKRTLAIGDIHGGLKSLLQIFELAKVSPDDELIFLGDYVDGWSESAQTIKWIMELSQKQQCIFIKGNHDVWCEEWLRTDKANSEWLLHGGKETVNSYASINAIEKKQQLDFFEKMKFFHIDESNRLFVHAGFTSMHGPQKEFFSSSFNWDRTLWEMALAMDKKIKEDSPYYPKRLKLFSEIFIGHTPTLYYNSELPMQACNVWNIDTGAAFTGKLTAMDIHTKKYWQSEKVKNLYPNETGRNKPKTSL